jgi:hypothetical protein
MYAYVVDEYLQGLASLFHELDVESEKRFFLPLFGQVGYY